MAAWVPSFVPQGIVDSWATIATGLLALSVAGHFFDVALAARFVRICYTFPWQRKTTPCPVAFEATHVHRSKVTTRDLDLMLHCNNARYPREADFARHGLFKQCGIFDVAWRAKMPLVTGAQTIRYRRELPFRKPFEIRTSIVGWDEKALFVQQLFVVRRRSGEEDVHAIMFVREAVVPGKQKHAEPLSVLFQKLGWTSLPKRKAPPAEVEQWLQSLDASSNRICPKRT
jgi:acyl-CoA thioesterase FadM